MKIIELTQGYICVVSDEDYKVLKKYSWCVSRGAGRNRKQGEPYAATVVNRKKIYMHRLIMGSPKDKIVDHINNQTLDNRRSNLRVVTAKENMRNRIDNKHKYYRK